ncbi:uncharacterized protein LOC126370139 [Pectinophora gossypiella]|uniref:uncharacterized protein LOC126370139 n=1 Tax=Pectinophora gossypiella TaxID=13191 RepID=UPI00214E236C|nr:uncharacterized protein LOC126370139 [Pectinophora gossypiella]
MNLLITGVTSQAFNENSDDDVIEVVRDEAPIEILSDGEELEMERQNHHQQSVIQNFHFTSFPPIDVGKEKNDLGDVEDPLKNDSPLSNDNNVPEKEPTLTSVAVPVIALPPPPSEAIPQTDEIPQEVNNGINDAIENTCGDQPKVDKANTIVDTVEQQLEVLFTDDKQEKEKDNAKSAVPTENNVSDNIQS